jgi:hypothetical protein
MSAPLQDDAAATVPVFRLAVLASGNGSNLQAIIDRLHKRPVGVQVLAPSLLGGPPVIEVALVVSDFPEARGGGAGPPPPPAPVAPRSWPSVASSVAATRAMPRSRRVGASRPGM